MQWWVKRCAEILQETNQMKRAARDICWLVVFCVGPLVTQAIAKPGKPVTTPPAIDFIELDKLAPADLHDPDGAVAKVCGNSVDEQEWRDHAEELEQSDGTRARLQR